MILSKLNLSWYTYTLFLYKKLTKNDEKNRQWKTETEIEIEMEKEIEIDERGGGNVPIYFIQLWNPTE